MKNPSDESHYRLLKKEIFENGHLFPIEEMRVIYLLTINYCIGRINAGISAFFRESFDLYRGGLENGTFLENGVLSRFTFQNAVTSGLNLREFEWVENFIKSYNKLLDEKHQESFVHFNQARLYFEQKDYDRGMKLLAQSDYDDILMTLNARAMLLKIYYELNEFDALDSLIESMSSYLQRKKVMGYHRNIFKNLIYCTKKLLKAIPGNVEQIEKFKSEIQAIEPLMERKWLLEQLDKL
jgi:tetratricopeptide (TPR) repeat protein